MLRQELNSRTPTVTETQRVWLVAEPPHHTQEVTAPAVHRSPPRPTRHNERVQLPFETAARPLYMKDSLLPD